MTDKIKLSSSPNHEKENQKTKNRKKKFCNEISRSEKNKLDSIDFYPSPPPHQPKKIKTKPELFSKFETQAKKKLNFNSVC